MSNHAETPGRTVIVGASAAGLATAACLQRHGVPYLLLEQGAQVAQRWRTDYDRLHLHTPRGLSGLPYRPMPRHYPRYPSRDQLVAYLEEYAAQLQLAPRFGKTVVCVESTDRGWMTHTPETSYRSRDVVIATGLARQPYLPSFNGLERFRGTVLHSRDYRTGAAYRGQSVLVVGLGNSGGEIALDLYEQGARPALARATGPVVEPSGQAPHRRHPARSCCPGRCPHPGVGRTSLALEIRALGRSGVRAWHQARSPAPPQPALRTA